MNIAEQVEAALDTGKAKAHEVLQSSDLAGQNVVQGAEQIGRLYRQLVPEGVTHWCNLSKEVGLINQLLIAPTILIDIAPVSEAEFEGLYGVTIADMTRLAEAGAVIPNIYVRNVTSWAESPWADKYSTIMSYAIANGELTDTYLDLRQRARDGKSFVDSVAEKRETVHWALGKLRVDELRAIASRYVEMASAEEGPDAVLTSVARAIGSNWAYIESLAPSGFAADIQDLICSGDAVAIVRGVKTARILKSEFASPITASLGGTHIWPDYARSARDLFKHEPKADEEGILEDLQGLAEALTYVNKRIRHHHPHITSSRPSELLEIALTHDWRERARQAWIAREAIGDLVIRGEVADGQFADLDRIYADLALQAKRWGNYVNWGGVAIVEGAAAATGALLYQPMLALILGGAGGVGGTIAHSAGLGERVVKNLMAQQRNPRSLFFSSVSELERMAQVPKRRRSSQR